MNDETKKIRMELLAYSIVFIFITAITTFFSFYLKPIMGDGSAFLMYPACFSGTAAFLTIWSYALEIKDKNKPVENINIIKG